MENNDKGLAYKFGRFMGSVFTACVAICLSACVIALTMKFIYWLF